MQYQTMVLELLQARPKLHRQLAHARSLLPTLERLAGELKASHEWWQDLLSRAMPSSSRSQMTSEALEIALQELTASLPPVSSADEDDPLSLDAAMAFLRQHTPPA